MFDNFLVIFSSNFPYFLCFHSEIIVFENILGIGGFATSAAVYLIDEKQEADKAQIEQEC
jgi:hypothetical protein